MFLFSIVIKRYEYKKGSPVLQREERACCFALLFDLRCVHCGSLKSECKRVEHEK